MVPFADTCSVPTSHAVACQNNRETMGLNPNEAPWDGLAWPLALDETLECDGTRFCFRKGERDTYDCNTDNECLRDGAGTRCNSDCGWDSDSFLELGGADCCDYDPGFTDSARHDALL
eukprot:511480-Rhodomonas_salina.1